MPAEPLRRQTTLVVGAADGVNVLLPACFASCLPRGEDAVAVAAEESRVEDPTRVQRAGGLVVAHVVLDHEEHVLALRRSIAEV